MPGVFIVTQKKELPKSLEFIKKWGGYASSVVCSNSGHWNFASRVQKRCCESWIKSATPSMSSHILNSIEKSVGFALKSDYEYVKKNVENLILDFPVSFKSELELNHGNSW